MQRSKNYKYGCKIPIDMPKIPRALIGHARIKEVLCLTEKEFNVEEQLVIFLYCVVKLPIREISDMVGLSSMHVSGTLLLFSEKLRHKINIFKMALSYDEADITDIEEILEI